MRGEIELFDSESYEGGPAYFEIVSRFGDLYVSYRQRFVMMMPDKPPFVPRKNGNYLPLGNRIICGHINQKYAICVYAGAHSSKFICFDVDDGNRETVKCIIDSLAELGFDREKIYLSTSGGKGYHVEIFFDGLMYTDKLRCVYDYVCDKNHLDKNKVEFRPTAGQSIKLPLSIHRKTGNVCWYLNSNTFEPIKTMDFVVQIQQVDVDFANKIIKQIKYIPVSTEEVHNESVTEKDISDDEHDEICGDHYPNIKQSGERHNLMVQIAVHNRYRGFSPAACRDELTHWYKRQDQKLIKESEPSVLADIDQIIRWAYSEKFQMVKKTNEIVFTPEDFRILAAQTIQSRRKIMFYILLCMKKYGHATASSGQISDLLGISRQGVIKALNCLQQGKWITVKKNRCVTKPEGVIRLPNTYFLGDGAIGWSRGYFFTSLPGLDHERDMFVKGVRYKVDRIQLPQDLKMDSVSILNSYASVMLQAFERDDLQEIMTKKEFNELEGIIC